MFVRLVVCLFVWLLWLVLMGLSWSWLWVLMVVVMIVGVLFLALSPTLKQHTQHALNTLHSTHSTHATNHTQQHTLNTSITPHTHNTTHLEVGGRAGQRLHVDAPLGGVEVEGLQGPLLAEALRHVDELVAPVVAELVVALWPLLSLLGFGGLRLDCGCGLNDCWCGRPLRSCRPSDQSVSTHPSVRPTAATRHGDRSILDVARANDPSNS